GEGFSSEVSTKRIVSSQSGQNRVPLRCWSDSRQPPTSTPSATPSLSHVQPSDGCPARGRSRSRRSPQSGHSSVHHGDGRTAPTGAGSHRHFENEASVYSSIRG